MKLSLIAPCYNEAENVAAFQDAVISAFAGCGYDYEIVFINDGSKDATMHNLRKIHKEQKRLEKKKNRETKTGNEKVDTKKSASKFSSKYKDRIQSIKESDYKKEQNQRLQKEAKEKEEFLKQINKK